MIAKQRFADIDVSKQSRGNEISRARNKLASSVKQTGVLDGYMSKSAFHRHSHLILLSLLLILITVAVYWEVKDHQFIECDDDLYVTENSQVLSGLTQEGVVWAFTATHAANWHPLTWLSHMLDCDLFGASPRGPHVTNLALHVVNTLLLFLFFARTTSAPGRSALLAAFFAVHPLHVESVAWVAERKDVLSAFFWLLTMWAYAWYGWAPALGRYLLVLFLMALGLMAKPMLVTLPLVLLLLDYWPLNRFPQPKPKKQGRRKNAKPKTTSAVSPWLRFGLEKMPLLALVALSSIITVIAQRWGGAVLSFQGWPLSERLANALLSYGKYIVKLFWPVGLAFYYPLVPVPFWQAAAATLGVLALSALVFWGRRRYPYLAVGWLWYLGALVPVIGLVQVGDQAMADRYTYVPYIGLLIMIIWGLGDLTGKWRHRRAVQAILAGGALAVCLIHTRQQVHLWRDSNTLFTHALKVTKDNYMAYNHLGMALSKQGMLDEAIPMFQKTIRISPSYAFGYNNLAITYAKQGNLALAIGAFKQAIRINPNQYQFYQNLCVAYQQQGNLAEARAMYEKVLQLQKQIPRLTIMDK